MRTKIAIFCSGSGSNAQKIMDHFSGNNEIEVVLLLSNKADAYALERAHRMNVPTHVFDRNAFYHTNEVLEELKKYKIDWIVLAGFLWLVPENLVECFPDKILNIHPALLPKYGGKGMYGLNVHKAVFENNEKESGMTIHYVNGKYDEGNIVFQATCSVQGLMSPEDIAHAVLVLEHRHFSEVIETEIKKNK